ncbi:MAG: DUF924 domain-containing protein [Myxococcota bacterium]|nr:DUF924 domain-containing protein [Myxococcota bacterium]
MQPGGSEEVLEFWFGALDANGRADEEHTRRWFEKNEAFDEQIRERFGEVHAAAARGERDAWLGTTRGRLALVIVLDQFSRNLFRGDAKSFACDERAFAAASEAVALGIDRTLALDERCFLYLPFMHSERLEHQKRCVELYRALLEEQPVELRSYIDNSLRFAKRHQVIVERFGRFPHRNAALGRSSTPEEIEFLKQPGSGF